MVQFLLQILKVGSQMVLEPNPLASKKSLSQFTEGLFGGWLLRHLFILIIPIVDKHAIIKAILLKLWWHHCEWAQGTDRRLNTPNLPLF